MASHVEPYNLRVAYSNFPPFVEVKNSSGSLVLNGVITGIVRDVASWMNISMTFIRSPGDIFGTWENNTWSGMVGMLYRNEVDLILNPIMPRPLLLEFAQFTNPIAVEAFTILSGKKPQDGSLFLFFSVLDSKVWMAIIVAAIAISVTSAALFKSATVSQHFVWINMTGEYAWILLSYMLRQNTSDKYLLRKSKTKLSLFLQLLVTFWVLGVGLLLMNAFQSLLISKLTVRKSRPFIDTMEDFLASDSTIGISPVEIEMESILKDSGIPAYDKVWKKIQPHLMPASKVFADETLEDVQRGKYCIFHGHLIMENRLSEFYKSKTFCQLHLSQNYFFPFPLILAMQRQTPPYIYEIFNSGITRSVDAGIPGRYMKATLEDSNKCTSYSDNKLRALGLKNIYGILFVWAVGLTCSAVVLSCEIIYNKTHRM